MTVISNLPNGKTILHVGCSLVLHESDPEYATLGTYTNGDPERQITVGTFTISLERWEQLAHDVLAYCIQRRLEESGG